MAKILSLLIPLVAANPSMLWPKPTSFVSGNVTVIVDSAIDFSSNVLVNRLEQAMARHREHMVGDSWISVVPTFRAISHNKCLPYLKKVIVTVGSDSLELSDRTNEKYTLQLSISGDEAQVVITAESIYGAMYGLESLTQMTQGPKGRRLLSKAPFTIHDGPRFSHRGLLLDTSRNYYPVDTIKRTIRAMSLTKLNVFHWHIVDSHSWPFQSLKHPLLSKVGAIFPNQVYTYTDISNLVNFALDHGVRVIPELEAPAHSYAIGLAYPEIKTCMDDDNWDQTAAEPPSGQIDPTNPKSIQIVNDILDEFVSLFPDKFIHLSGDEVNLRCWNNTKSIRDYVEAKGVTLDLLLTDFATKMHRRAEKHKKSIMVWQEILLNHNIPLPEDTLVQVWLGAEDTKRIVDRGHRVVASSYQYWYLDCGKGSWIGDSSKGSSWCDPYKHWQMIYSYDLLANLTQSQETMVAGGEVAIWSEQTDEINLDRVAWPRSAAAAEVLWSGNREPDGKVRGTKDVLPRFNNFRFYLVQNGINAEPNQPLWCVVNPGRCDTPRSLKTFH